MTSDFNPYASPQVTEIRDKPTDDESVRREFLSHEASVQSIGSLYVIGTIFLLLALANYTFEFIRETEGWPELVLVGVMLAVSGGLAYGLLWLRPWARVAGVIASALGLFAIPCGTVISVYVLYLLLSRKGRKVFSADYRRVIDATPHIKYRTSRWMWILLAVIVLATVGGIAALILLG